MLQDQCRYTRCGPRVRHADRHQGAVGEAGLQPDRWLAINNNDLVAEASQVIGSGYADDAGTENYRSHRGGLARIVARFGTIMIFSLEVGLRRRSRSRSVCRRLESTLADLNLVKLFLGLKRIELTCG